LLHRGARAILDEVYHEGLDGERMSKVYLVGAGTRRPELIRLKAAALPSRPTAVLYDNLANAELLNLAPAAAERIYVGKKRAESCALTAGNLPLSFLDRGQSAGLKRCSPEGWRSFHLRARRRGSRGSGRRRPSF